MSKAPALTVRQPWAAAIVHLGKDVENRPRRTNYRGRLYVHAGKQMDSEALADLDAVVIGSRRPLPIETGMVIGAVDVVGCHHADYSLQETAEEAGLGTHKVAADYEGDGLWAVRLMEKGQSNAE